MRRFAALIEVLDRTASVNEKAAALAGYFRTAPPADGAWALYFLTGRRLERRLPARLLAGWAMAAAGVADWLFEECYGTVGDLVETIVLVLDTLPRSPGDGADAALSLSAWIEERVLPLKELPAEEQRTRLLAWWAALDRGQAFVLTKILTGELKAGVSKTVLERALGEVAGLPPATMAARLEGGWEPTAASLRQLLSAGDSSGDGGGTAPSVPPREETVEEPKERPYSVDAVLVYARPGQGWRASHFTDYTFAVWSGAELVPFTKADAGLSETEVVELDRWIRRHTLQRFGPVRAVEPVHVFEVAFEGIAASSRHRSGVAVRSPRIARWRTDKAAAEADTLERVQALVESPA
ncbi:MAG TPA: hypothetical protein VEL74_10420 [Thermoanaerobaculia bacterium]|nr:hypothetical protein [Thermoanaerobaculia bacterium]